MVNWRPISPATHNKAERATTNVRLPSCKTQSRCLHLDITVSVTKTLRWINGLRYLRSLCIPFKLKMQFINNKVLGVATIGVDGVDKISRFNSRAKYKKDALRLQLAPERAR